MNIVTSKDGTSIAFDRSGEGPAIIVIGGALSDRSAVAPLAALLGTRFTVFAYDRRGRGDSGDTAPYAVEREVEDIEALITEAGGSALVFGHSSGAVLALHAARQLPIVKLALYEPPFIVDQSRPLLPEGYTNKLTELISAGQRGEAVEWFMTRAVGVPADMVAQMRHAPMWAGLEAIAPTLAYDNTIMGDTMLGSPLPLRQWASVTMPTLVMGGGASQAWAHNAVLALVGVLPHAQHRTLEGQDHGAAPEVIAPVLAEFFGA